MSIKGIREKYKKRVTNMGREGGVLKKKGVKKHEKPE